MSEQAQIAEVLRRIEVARNEHWQKHLREHPHADGESCPRDYGIHDTYAHAADIVRDVLRAARPPGPGTCPSLCVERSHPGREHDEAEDGCYCWQLCEMGPTCPGANAGLDRGCWRTKTTGEPL